MMLRRLHLTSGNDWIRELALIGADPGCWDRARLRSGVLVFRVGPFSSPAANILKQNMLAADCDALVSRGVIDCSCETSEAIVIGTPRDLTRACESLAHQPFELGDLSEKILQAVSHCLGGGSGGAALSWGGHWIDLSGGPAIVGILNVTPDSFSDGGHYLDPEAAVTYGIGMADEGACIVDVGAESTRPGSRSVPPEEQMARIAPVVSGLHEARPDLVISIDTSHADVARRALEEGASMINDVRALESPELRSLAAESEVPVVLMHMQGRPETMQDSPGYEDCVGEVYHFLERAVGRALESGVRKELTIVDPGIGFGKRLRDNLDILRRLREFRWLGCPVMLGHSRKSFIARMLGDIPAEERDAYTHQVTAIIGRNADLLRVHDVPGTVMALRISGLIADHPIDEESSGE